MHIIKCHMCKLSTDTCGEACIDMEDVTSLYKDGISKKDAFTKGFCTNHKCEHNPSGLQCTLESCVYGFNKQVD